MLSTIEFIHNTGRYRMKDREKARVFQEIAMTALSSRKSIAVKTNIRPMTVSAAVQELIDDNLVVECGNSEKEGRGRPEVFLEVNHNRLVAVSMHVQARQLLTSVVNMKEEPICEHTEQLDHSISNEDFIEACYRSFDEVKQQLPPESEILGIGVSLIGTVASSSSIWISAARWRNIKNLDFSALQTKVGIPVSITRVQDAELVHFIQKHPAYSDKNIVFVHWGFGIGASYAHKGRIQGSTIGRFCEVGHTRISMKHDKICQCGAIGCLETEAALWAISSDLKGVLSGSLTEEQHVANAMKDMNLSEHPAILKALDYVNLAILNLHQVFYPDTLIIIGPFVENEELFNSMRDFFYEHIPDYARDGVEFRHISGGFKGCMPGSVYPFFKKRLKALLTFSTAESHGTPHV